MILKEYQEKKANRKLKNSRCISYNPEFIPDYNKYEKYRFVENVRDGLRWLGPIHKIEGNRIKHEGWWMSDFMDERVYGVLAQLPSRGGEPLYVPGYQTSIDVWNFRDDDAVLDFTAVTTDKNKAIHNADQMAERLAEAEREFHRKDDINQSICGHKEDILRLRKEVREIIPSLRYLRKVDGYAHDLIGPVKVYTPEVEKVFAEFIRRRRIASHMAWRDIKQLEDEL